MMRAILFDFCRVLVFPKKEGYFGDLNSLHKELSKDINYNFNDHFVFNQELMNFIKENGIDVKFSLHIFTSGKIQETIECQRFLNGYFKKVFSSGKLNLSKKETSSYLMIAEELNLNPGEILFVDDVRENTVAAEAAGFCTITFRNNMQFETEIEGYILENTKKC